MCFPRVEGLGVVVVAGAWGKNKAVVLTTINKNGINVLFYYPTLATLKS